MKKIPGMSKVMPEEAYAEAEAEMKRTEAIIYSMTAKERHRPEIINGSRRRRIAAGSGTMVQDVNALLREFEKMKKMMKGMMKGGKPGKGFGRGAPPAARRGMF